MHADNQVLQSRFLQGVFEFEGRGLQQPFRLSDELRYQVPQGKQAQMIHFRAGNSSDALIYVALMQNDSPKRYFCVGARADTHVALAIAEDFEAGESCELFVAAPEKVSGWIVLDVGFMEF